MLFPCLLWSQMAEQSAYADSLRRLVHKFEASKDDSALAFTLVELGDYYTEIGDFAVASGHLDRSIRLFNKLGNKTGLARSYHALTTVSYALHDISLLEVNARRVLELATELRDSFLIGSACNSLAVVAEQHRDYQKALAFYQRAQKVIDVSSDYMPYLLTNMGDCYLLLGELDKAMTLTREAIRHPLADSSILCTALLNETLILSALGQYDLAISKLKDIELHFGQLNYFDLPRDIARTFAHVYASAGMHRDAYVSLLKFYTLDSTLASAEHRNMYARLETAFKTQHKEQENQRLRWRLMRQRYVIVLVLLLGSLVFALYNQMKVKNKLLETEKQLAEKEKREAVGQLELKKVELNGYIRTLVEKNSLIEEFIEREKQRTNNETLLRENNTLRSMTLLTDDQWRTFQEKFEMVHTGFFDQVMNKLPNLTESEKRLLALTKLKLTNKEMAAMLGVSPESVVKARYRMRKKINPADIEDLEVNI